MENNSITFKRNYRPHATLMSSSTPIDIEHVIHGDACMEEVLEQFRHFLLGCGYCFDGKIEVVPFDE